MPAPTIATAMRRLGGSADERAAADGAPADGVASDRGAADDEGGALSDPPDEG